MATIALPLLCGLLFPLITGFPFIEKCIRWECSAEGVEWLCGSDGRSYPNRCEFERIRCFGVGIRIRAMGKCPKKDERTEFIPIGGSSRCSARRRLRFLQTLFSQFRTEMIAKREQPIGGMRTARRSAAKWKFNRLDSDGDGVLSRGEYHEFRRFIRQWPKLKRCSRSFVGDCDTDKDRRLSFGEWNHCTVHEFERLSIAPHPTRNPFLYLLKPQN